MKRLWRCLRAALRPLPRPGVVLSEGWSAPAGASGMLDPCDCNAWGTEKEHRPEAWTHSSDFRPDFAVRHPPCPRWRPRDPVPPKGGSGVRWQPDRPNPDAALFALHALASKMLAEALTGAARQDIAAQIAAESSGQSCGMALTRPEMATVIRSPRPEYRRPAPTPVPSGGKHQSG